MKLTLAFMAASVLFAADPVLTPADREPSHVALQKLNQAEALALQLQVQWFMKQSEIDSFRAAYTTERDKLKAKCGGKLTVKDGLDQCEHAAEKPK
jgi:hypothetical protein